MVSAHCLITVLHFSAFPSKNVSVHFVLVEMTAMPVKIIKTHTHTHTIHDHRRNAACDWFNVSFCMVIVCTPTKKKNYNTSRHSRISLSIQFMYNSYLYLEFISIVYFRFGSLFFSTHEHIRINMGNTVN